MKLEQALELVDELRETIAKRDKEIELLETRIEEIPEKVGDALREALIPYADQLAEIQTPHGRYRWIERQVTLAGCE